MKKNWTAILVIVLGIMSVDMFSALIASCYSAPRPADQQQPDQSYKETARERGGVVTWFALATLDAGPEAFTAGATVVIALFTIVLAIATNRLWSAALGQSDDTKKTIAEAVKSSAAMEAVAASMAQNVKHLETTVATNKRIADRQKLVSEMQLRAYVSVIIGSAVTQDQATGTYFYGSAVMVNSGQTPAKRVEHSVDVGIFPSPLPPDFVLPAARNARIREGMLPPHQNRTLGASLGAFIPDADMGPIKKGDGRGFYIWGDVAYEDAFDERRTTTFCHLLTFLPDGKTWGYYSPGRNTAT
jgi:hypothetical protein